jgi:hypothetical protein
MINCTNLSKYIVSNPIIEPKRNPIIDFKLLSTHSDVDRTRRRRRRIRRPHFFVELKTVKTQCFTVFFLLLLLNWNYRNAAFNSAVVEILLWVNSSMVVLNWVQRMKKKALDCNFGFFVTVACSVNWFSKVFFFFIYFFFKKDK